jgi:hypothetical protein
LNTKHCPSSARDSISGDGTWVHESIDRPLSFDSA